MQLVKSARPRHLGGALALVGMLGIFWLFAAGDGLGGRTFETAGRPRSVEAPLGATLATHLQAKAGDPASGRIPQPSESEPAPTRSEPSAVQGRGQEAEGTCARSFEQEMRAAVAGGDDSRARRLMIERGLAEFQEAGASGKAVAASLPLALSLITCLERKGGVYVALQDGDPRLSQLQEQQANGRTHLFLMNGTWYAFDKGLYADFDRWSAHMNGPGPSKNPSAFSASSGEMEPDLQAAIETRMLEAIAALGG